ncbi:TERF1-interacting nuclear factor 2 [Myripristis murdjan]|uniref:TERF1 (TRF1)-interacting nuclear factor 2 n=1 Tax=Myripristis murdjan TaxID=586833 RepID=A0A667YYJ5_9TELE|nr:uncharacterized protein LOC115376869 [Myripristis murdjan]
MAAKKPTENEASLPFAALQLLAPPVRLVSAALWKVMKHRDVMQYGTVEEFVTSACENVPGLLTLRHQAKLTLGLRARLILELFASQDQPDPSVIKSHMKRIRVPTPSTAMKKKDIKIEKTVSNFQALVRTLLSNPAEKEHFLKEEFPVDYGPLYDQELEKLLWEFLIRLDQLLPVPNLSQTVSWLSTAPPVLEECARSATQPQLLKILLQHQTCLGHLESAASLPPNMGDSILSSLSLPPSGRVPSAQPTGSRNTSAAQSDSSGPLPKTSCTQTGGETHSLTPVIGLISSEDVPVMISANKKKLRGEQLASSKDATNEDLEPKGNMTFTVIKRRQESRGEEQVEEDGGMPERSSGIKRKHPNQRQSDSDEEEEEVRATRTGKKRITRSLRNSISKLKQNRRDLRSKGNREKCTNTGADKSDRAAVTSSVTQLDFKLLKLPEDPSLFSVLSCCLHNQPSVIVSRLKLTSSNTNESSRGAKPSPVLPQDEGKRSPVVARTQSSTSHCLQRPEFDSPGLDDKENHPALPGKSSSSSARRRNTEAVLSPGDSEDFIGDSEDEATKNFKSRLFQKRYCKTKHGTYVPTLREFCKPRRDRRDLLSPGNGHR